MAATLAPSMAITLQTAPTSNRAAVMPPKSKDDFLGAGRRKLDKFREKRANAAKPKAPLAYEQKEKEREKENTIEQHLHAAATEQSTDSTQPILTATSVLQALPTLPQTSLSVGSNVHESIPLRPSSNHLNGQKDGENETGGFRLSTVATDSTVLLGPQFSSDGDQRDVEKEIEKRSFGTSTLPTAYVPFGANSWVQPSQRVASEKFENERQESHSLSSPSSHLLQVGTTVSSTKPSSLVRRLSEGSISDHKADEKYREGENETQRSGNMSLTASRVPHVVDKTWSTRPFILSRRPSEGSISEHKADEEYGAKEIEKVNFDWRAQNSVEPPVDRSPIPEVPASLAVSNIDAASNGSLFYSSNQGHPGSNKDDFDALEQHIEDLTQEKFALQRGLDKTRALVESLTQDNAALTEDYNQQAARVDELKEELARCQEYIRSQEIELRSFKAERDKAQQETFAAKERSRSLAAETIQVEENYRKTRSQELKLRKEVESLRYEIESLRKQNSSIEKDRLNAIVMNEALQEEKKVLLARIREAAETTAPAPAPIAAKEDASTSTEDLVAEEQSSENEPETGTTDSSFLYPTSLPAEQLRVIENINALVDELGREREAILRALRSETDSVARLKIENAELSQKLERQTQQLELAFAQNMARAGSLPSPPVFQTSEEIEYIDEGDEVVDRVLGWIMRLFPGGKRGGGKQL